MRKKINWKFLIELGVFVLQYIATQVVTFAASMLLPGMVNLQQGRPAIFALIVGICFSLGSFLIGWLAVRRNWLSAGSGLPVRLAGTLVGAFLPLAVALLLYGTPEAGNPFFFISVWGSILGFHLPAWLSRSSPAN
jgi:hypothetical protein